MERDQVSDEDQTMHQVQASDEDHSLKQQAMSVVQTKRSIVEKDPYRQTYHVMPPVGLLNDPNGVIQWQGVYHLFYQWMPFKTGHGAKFWGHYTSTDLLTWKPEPIALAPSSWYDKSGCYSGSAVVHNDVMYLFYTGNVKDADGNRRTYQCMATSTDGIHFKKQGVVAHLPPGYTPHFRDPKVWRHDDRWLMVVGAQSTQLQGQVVLFESFDLYEWSFIGPLAGSGMPPLGEFGYMWECPDLFHLDGQDILIMSPQGMEPEGDDYHNLHQAGYVAGRLDYDSGCFTHGAFHMLDHGFDFYAPQTTVDNQGRRILIAWMNMWESDMPTKEHGWAGAMTLPRVLEWNNDRLITKPLPELERLRHNEVKHRDVQVYDQLRLEGVSGRCIELDMCVQMEKDAQFGLKLGMNEELHEETYLRYDAGTGKLTLDRNRSGQGEGGERHVAVALQEQVLNLHMYVDTSSVEIFINGGEQVMTARIFPGNNAQDIRFYANGQVKILELAKWDLKPAIVF
jgi:beta-fructofuranosidase